MVKAEVIRRRLNKLDEYLSILRDLQKYDYQAFISNPERYGSAERFLQLVIETVLDLGNHVIAELALGVVNWYSDIPAILVETGHIDDDLKEKWIRMIGFRNILVHEYTDIDLQVVYEVLQHQLGDIEALKQVFARFL